MFKRVVSAEWNFLYVNWKGFDVFGQLMSELSWLATAFSRILERQLRLDTGWYYSMLSVSSVDVFKKHENSLEMWRKKSFRNYLKHNTITANNDEGQWFNYSKGLAWVFNSSFKTWKSLGFAQFCSLTERDQVPPRGTRRTSYGSKCALPGLQHITYQHRKVGRLPYCMTDVTRNTAGST